MTLFDMYQNIPETLSKRFYCLEGTYTYCGSGGSKIVHGVEIRLEESLPLISEIGTCTALAVFSGQ